MRLRIATFNVENLASRHSYGPRERPETAPALSLFDFPEPETRESVEASVAVAIEDDKRELTALAIAETRADIIALQEIDNQSVLHAFFANYVHRVADIRYGHFKLVDGNDPRGIEVAFAARKDLVNEKGVTVTSHHEASFGELGCYDEALRALRIEPHHRVFNRDCLEVALDLGEAELTLYLCHFKAVTANGRTAGREGSLALRQAEAKAVRRLVEARFGEGWREANWVVLGDLNDFRERILPGAQVEPASPASFDVLVEDFAVNPVEALPAAERWTHYFRGPGRDGEVREEHVQLDYVLLSPALAKANPTPKVEIIRRGLPYRVPLDPAAPDRSMPYLATRADRYPRVGWDRPKASDHCPLVVEIEVPLMRRGHPGRAQRDSGSMPPTREQPWIPALRVTPAGMTA
jgi:endonuclease/exonuclease/phosphatase family metal-dependent hydrolase